MAIFPNNPQSALNAAVEIISTLEEYNLYRKKFNYIPIHVGIGLHYGHTVLGIMGNDKQMQGSVISDSVNTAARLEQLAKQFDASIILSEATLQKASQGIYYQSRSIGKIPLKGKSEKMTLHEVFHGDTLERKKLRLESLKYLDKAIQSFERSNWTEAQILFEKILKAHPNDQVAIYYLQQIEGLLATQTHRKKSS